MGRAVQGITPSRLPAQALLKAAERNVCNCIAVQNGTPMEHLSNISRTAEAFSLASFLTEGDCLTSAVTGILLPFL